MFKNAFKYAFENMQTLHYPKLISVPQVSCAYYIFFLFCSTKRNTCWLALSLL